MSLLRIVREERYKKRLTPLPFFFTFANAGLGFLAIIKALEEQYTASAYCLIFAALMDVCDGRLARALGTTSQIGLELDSLVDGVSFCLAPAVIFYSTYSCPPGFFYIATLIAYVCAGLYRLAKFNMATGSSKYFSGLPTPMAALSVAGLILHHNWLLTHLPASSFGQALPFLYVAFLAVLMPSSIPFKKHSALSRFEIVSMFCIVNTGMIILSIFHYPWLLIIMSSYLLITLLHCLSSRFLIFQAK